MGLSYKFVNEHVQLLTTNSASIPGTVAAEDGSQYLELGSSVVRCTAQPEVDLS